MPKQISDVVRSCNELRLPNALLTWLKMLPNMPLPQSPMLQKLAQLPMLPKPQLALNGGYYKSRYLGLKSDSRMSVTDSTHAFTFMTSLWGVIMFTTVKLFVVIALD